MAHINWLERYPNSNDRFMVQDAYDTAVKLELLDAIKNLNPERGFMFTNSPVIDKISANLKYFYFDNLARQSLEKLHRY